MNPIRKSFDLIVFKNFASNVLPLSSSGKSRVIMQPTD